MFQLDRDTGFKVVTTPVRGSKPAICPEFSGAPAVPLCTLRGPPSRDAREQKNVIPDVPFCVDEQRAESYNPHMRPPRGGRKLLRVQASDAVRKLEAVKREDMLNLKVHTYSDMPGCVGFAEGFGQAVAKMHLVCKGSHAKIWCLALCGPPEIASLYTVQVIFLTAHCSAAVIIKDISNLVGKPSLFTNPLDCEDLKWQKARTHLQRRAALWRQEKNRWRVLRNVCGFAAVLKHSSRREMPNEHQSKGSRGPHSEPEPSSPLSVKPQSVPPTSHLSARDGDRLRRRLWALQQLFGDLWERTLPGNDCWTNSSTGFNAGEEPPTFTITV
ncbi:hypothetical protein EYF80_004515 [Liparis tanakae]|uniref:Uncharacterized protein n=1 Tax=Liparis tanakae TaxID=230148 RepID=A0A4Z2J489_9TELE|nr:hypothetical protein EYF80_004515 [Liparis tanakae]